MAELPTGTVSLVFSDIERSTALLARLGPAYAEALDAQRHLLRDAWASHQGVELGTEGDSFFVAFATALDAVAATVQAQRALAGFAWPAGERVRIRMGVHTGTPTPHDGGYVGMDVHRAARIAAVAHGGQVVVSEATARLLPETADVTLRDLGLHQLKDLREPEHLFQLDIAGLETEFEAVRSLGAVTNLPVPATPLVGRDGELGELTHLLGTPEVRLVTLTGPGGSGKTRLAVAVARQLVSAFPDGVYFVPLAAVTTPDEMWTAIGEVLGVPPEGRIPPGFFSHVAHRSALFVLDNLEQLPAADTVVSQLLVEAPQAVVIATSRRPLHVAGEHEHPVPTLELPAGSGLDDGEASGAVQLFVQHARMVRPSFTLSQQNAADVAEVCRRLDGLPLAIELAAARSKLLSPRALLTRLDQALELGDAGVDRPARQQTLRDTIAWSYDLLDAAHQSLFRRLGVFGGGADLDAIAAVSSSPAEELDPLELLSGLVDASLTVVTEELDGEPRIGLLETIRAYALDRLAEAGELHEVRFAHAHHFLAVAHELTRPTHGSVEGVLPGRRMLEVELDNFREALAWAFRADGSTTESRLGVALCATLGGLWNHAGYFAESARWLELAIDQAGDEDSPELATCLHALAWLSQGTGKLDRDYQLLTRSVAMWRRLGDQEGLSLALSRLAAQLQSMGDLGGRSRGGRGGRRAGEGVWREVPAGQRARAPVQPRGGRPGPRALARAGAGGRGHLYRDRG